MIESDEKLQQFLTEHADRPVTASDRIALQMKDVLPGVKQDQFLNAVDEEFAVNIDSSDFEDMCIADCLENIKLQIADAYPEEEHSGDDESDED